MLEARNIKLTAEVSSLEQSLEAMSRAQEIIVRERDRLTEDLSQLKVGKEGQFVTLQSIYPLSSLAGWGFPNTGIWRHWC